MLRSLIVVSVCCIGASLAIVCYEGIFRYPDGVTPTLEYNCTTESYCFKSWVDKYTDGNLVTAEVKYACGSTGTCKSNACIGPAENRRCCCTGDLCNGGDGATIIKSLLITSVAVMAWRML